MRHLWYGAWFVAVSSCLLLGPWWLSAEVSPDALSFPRGQYGQKSEATERLTQGDLKYLVLMGPCGFLGAAQRGPMHIAEAEKASGEKDRQAALGVWRQYAECERTRQFRPCFRLLSQGALRLWEEKGVKTDDQYYDVKGSEEIGFSDFKVLNVQRTGGQIIITTRATGGGERGTFEAQIEYVFVQENGEWKMDTIIEGNKKYLP